MICARHKMPHMGQSRGNQAALRTDKAHRAQGKNIACTAKHLRQHTEGFKRKEFKLKKCGPSQKAWQGKEPYLPACPA
eukprot:5293362-Amphidinium_carterae.2